MITPIISGMTYAEYVAAMNDNFAEFLDSFTDVTIAMTWQEIEDTYNTNVGSTLSVVGVRGSTMLGVINNRNATEYNIPISTPTDISISRVNEFMKIDWTNVSSGHKIQVWESINGGSYVLAATTPTNGLTTYNFECHQSANISVKLKGVRGNGDVSSEFTAVESMKMPIVWKAVQAEIGKIDFKYLWVTTGYAINLDWGDGTNVDLSTDSNFTNPNATKTYAETGTYYIVISGDTEKITNFDNVGSVGKLSGNIGKLVLPTVLRGWHIFGQNFNGDVSNWVLPPTIEVVNMGALGPAGARVTGSIGHWDLSQCTGLWDFHLEGNDLTGDVGEWAIPEGQVILPASVAHFTTNGTQLRGDVTNMSLPNSSVYTTVLIILGLYHTGNLTNWVLDIKTTTVRLNYCTLLTGDLSQVLIPDYNGSGGLQAFEANYGTKFTKMFRGHFKWVTSFLFREANMPAQEIEDLLVYVDNYFTGGVVPMCNCTYWLDGANNGIASATALAAKTSIEGKYTSAGFTATIVVRTT